MGKFSDIVILSDLDGTLFNSDCKVSKGNAEAIEYFKSEGGLFAVASGRHPDNIRLYFDVFTPNAPCICYNGGMIYDFESKKHLMSRQLPESALDIAYKMDSMFPESCVAIETLKCMNITKTNEVSKRLLEIVECRPEYFEKYEDVRDPWVKLSVWADEQTSKLVEKEFARLSPLPDGMRSVRTHACAIEVLSGETDKGYALEEYKKLFDASKKFFALGDNENDNIMLDKADVSIVPSNANPETVGYATEQLEVSCDEDFVKAAIERIEKAYI